MFPCGLDPIPVRDTIHRHDAKMSLQIDFAYLPEFPLPELDYNSPEYISSVRVPILPTYNPVAANREMDPLTSTSTLKPTISTVAGETTHINTPSAMSDVDDGAHHESTDFHDVVSTLASGADVIRGASRNVLIGTEGGEEPVHRAKGVVKGIWTGLMDDVFGPRTPQSGAFPKT